MCFVKKSFLVFAVLGILMFPVATVVADWDPSMPTKWVQLPDESPNGMDVNATWQDPGVWPYVKVLADDFPCDKPGPITDIHVWGSWLNDLIDPTATFKLSIHDDVPAGVDAPYSHPGPLRWEQYFGPGMYQEMLWSEGPEQFYDPNDDEIIGGDNQMWLYNFIIPEAEAFIQEGAPGAEMIYWLDVQVQTDSVFGWKTTVDPWNDDAVFADTEFFGGDPTGPALPPVFWQDMHYPDGHAYQGDSINLAFAITTVPEPGTIVLLITAGLGLLLFAWRRRK